MTDERSRPYEGLTPDVVLDALDSVGLRGDGRLLALNSYENRVYQVSLETGGHVVAKFYRPGRWSDAQILEEHAFSEELSRHEVPVVAPQRANDQTLNEFKGFRFAVYPRCGGRTPELEDEKVLEWIGRFLGRIHAIGAARPFLHRPALTPETFGTEARDWLFESGMVPADIRDVWAGVVDEGLDKVTSRFDEVRPLKTIRLHGDCHVGNILWAEGGNRAEALSGPHFVDLDDARTGPAVQDLWMLLPGDRANAEKSLKSLLAGYRTFFDFNPEELHLVEALRTLRLIHYSAWLARRWDDPAFPAAFPWFGTPRYWQDRILELREQAAAMDEPPLVG